MNLYQQRVGSSGDSSLGHRWNLIATPGRVARVGSYRKMRELLEYRNRRDIERISQVRLERANASLAENHFAIAARHYVLGGEQRLFDSSRRSPFEQNRFVDSPNFAKQIEVLHIACADLKYVNVANEQRNL